MFQSAKKKILYVHHDMGRSGASKSLSFLLDKLDSSQFAAKVHCIFGGPVIELFKEKEVEVLSERGIYPFHGSTVTGMSLKIFLRNIVRLPQSFFTAVKLIKNLQPDLIHLNSSCLFIVALAAKFVNKNIKVVCHVREPLLEKSFSAFIMRYFNYLFVDQFIAIDRFTGNSMKSNNNLHVVYNAVNFEEYNKNIPKGRIRKELGLQVEDVIFLYLARFSKSNGALELVQTANKLLSGFPNFHFVLAGFNEGARDTYTMKVLKAAVGNENIHLLSFQNTVTTLIADANVMVVPFTQPHFARSIVEASAMGIPSIGSNIGGVNELIIDKETGLLYDDLQGLYECCIELGLNNLLRKKMGEAALKFAEDHFDNRKSSKKVFQIYSDLLNPSNESLIV